MLIPKENEKDIQEIPAAILKSMRLELVEHMDEVLRKALVLEDPENFLREPCGRAAAPSSPPIAPAEPPAPTDHRALTGSEDGAMTQSDLIERLAERFELTR